MCRYTFNWLITQRIIVFPINRTYFISVHILLWRDWQNVEKIVAKFPMISVGLSSTSRFWLSVVVNSDTETHALLEWLILCFLIECFSLIRKATPHTNPCSQFLTILCFIPHLTDITSTTKNRGSCTTCCLFHEQLCLLWKGQGV